MLTSDELKVLRERGESDAKILNRYREFDPETAGDIDTLLKRGEPANKILDRLTAYHASSEAPQDRPDGQADKGWVDTYKNALQYGAANVARGLSKSAKAAGFDKTGDVLESGAHMVEPAQGAYDPAGGHFDYKDPSTYKYIPRTLVEGAPGLATDLAAGAIGSVAGPAGSVAMFGASNAARNFGPNLEARMENQGPGAKPTATDYGAAGASTLAQAALARLGINPAISGVAKGAGAAVIPQVIGQVGKAGLAEASTGAVGNLVDQAGRIAGTKADNTTVGGGGVNWDEVGNNAAISGVTGATVRGLRGIGDATNAVRFRDVDPDAAARVVARLDANGIKPDGADGAYKAVTMARKTLDKAIGAAHDDLKPLLKSSGDLEETRGLIRDARTILANHGEVPEEKLQAIRDSIGGTKKGAPFVDLLEERQALNQLASKGNFDPATRTHAGGIVASPAVQNLLNPSRYVAQKVAAGAAGVAGLSSLGALGVLATNAAPIGAGIAGAYGGARLLDNAIGLRNPTQEFANRFRGLQKASRSYEDLPDPIAAAQAAKDQAQAEKAAQKGASGADKAAFKENSQTLEQAVKLARATKKLREDAEATRSKQEDAAWKAKAAQDAQDARIAEQADKAWNQREAAPGARQAQEEAMWKQLEAQRAQEVNDDLTAQEGIRSGRFKQIEEALLAGQAAKKLRDAAEATKSKEADKAWATKSKMDAEAAKRAEQADKAWGEREKAPKMPSEDDLWAAHEKAQLEAEGGDLEAQAGIQAGYKALAAKALAAQQTKSKQTDKAWDKKAQQDTAQARLEATVNRDYGRAETQRNARTPDQIKAAQEEAMWRDHQAPAPDDYNEMDAIQAIQRELKARENASKYILRQAKKDAPAPQADDVTEALKVRVRAQKKTERPSEAPQDSPASDNPDVFRYTHGDQTVERPKDPVEFPKAYGAKVKLNMATRAAFAKDLLDAAGERQAPVIDAMLSKLNQNSRFWYKADDQGRSAQHIIFETLDELPEKVRGKLEDIYNKHEGKLRGTYRE
jgi:hypothetical protein